MKNRHSILIALTICAGLVIVGMVSGLSQIAQGRPPHSPFQDEPIPPVGFIGSVDPTSSNPNVEPSSNFDLSTLPTTETVRRSTLRVPIPENQETSIGSPGTIHTPATNTSATIRSQTVKGPLSTVKRPLSTGSHARQSIGPRRTAGFLPAQTEQLPLPGPAGDGDEIQPLMPAPRTTQPSSVLPGSLPRATPSFIGPPIGSTLVPGTANRGFLTPIVSQPGAIAPQTGVAHAAGCPCGCQPQCTTTTIYVPVWETRYMNVLETRYRSEIRQQKYQTTHVVYDDIPKTESYTVDVPQQKTRTFTENRREEYQVPVNENFTVMVQKPQQRKVLVDREEAYEVPVETPYTVMVPQRKEIQETKYKTVVDKEPKQVRYSVNVPKERTRIEVEYEKVPVQKTVRRATIEMVEERRTRPKIVYEDEVRTRTVKQEYVVYEDLQLVSDVDHFRYIERTQPGKEPFFSYQDKTDFVEHTDSVQTSRDADKTIDYKITVPYIDRVKETYYESEPYEETITKTFPIRTQVPRQVTKTYKVRIPVTEHVQQPYTIEVPYEVMETAYRTITKQVPVTKYRTITRDMGSWKREVSTTPTCSIFQDACGCTTCTPGMQTCQKNIWCPKIVTQRIPYTDYRDVPQQLAYQVPKLRKRTETRTRKVPVTRYKVETRTATLDVLDFQQGTRTENFIVTKYRWVPKTRLVDVKRVREETRQKTVPFVEFQETSKTKQIPFTYRMPVRGERDIELPYIERQKYTLPERTTVKVPVVKTREVQEQYTVRVWKESKEVYTVKVPVKRFVDKVVTEYIDVPRTKEIKYTEMVPEIRTRVEYVDVKRKVPVYETKMVTELVPQIKTRTTTRTATRTVEEYQIKTFMVMVPEVRTREVFKTKYRDVPMVRTENYWENVPETRYRTRMVKVPRKVQREHVRAYSVPIPYQVRVSVPFKTCRMVAKTITVPIEPVCDNCARNFGQLRDASGAYLNYGAHQIGIGIEQAGQAWDRMINQ